MHRAFRELSHLGGYDGEALPRLAGPGCLDRGVQREQVGLPGDVVDHLKDLVDLLRPFTQRQREWLGTIEDNADRLVTLTDDLLDIARIEAGKIELKHTPLDLVPLIHEVVRVLHPQLEGKGQCLTLDLAAALPTIRFANASGVSPGSRGAKLCVS